jgi:hypothetical protein
MGGRGGQIRNGWVPDGRRWLCRWTASSNTLDTGSQSVKVKEFGLPATLADKLRLSFPTWLTRLSNGWT